ncbi:hypothetical protein IAT40_007042 [Kwoniella sp. CBS 6097]
MQSNHMTPLLNRPPLWPIGFSAHHTTSMFFNAFGIAQPITTGSFTATFFDPTSCLFYYQTIPVPVLVPNATVGSSSSSSSSISAQVQAQAVAQAQASIWQVNPQDGSGFALGNQTDQRFLAVAGPSRTKRREDWATRKAKAKAKLKVLSFDEDGDEDKDKDKARHELHRDSPPHLGSPSFLRTVITTDNDNNDDDDKFHLILEASSSLDMLRGHGADISTPQMPKPLDEITSTKQPCSLPDQLGAVAPGVGIQIEEVARITREQTPPLPDFIPFCESPSSSPSPSPSPPASLIPPSSFRATGPLRSVDVSNIPEPTQALTPSSETIKSCSNHLKKRKRTEAVQLKAKEMSQPADARRRGLTLEAYLRNKVSDKDANRRAFQQYKAMKREGLRSGE